MLIAPPHPHQGNPRSTGVPHFQAPQEFGPTEGQEAAVKVAGRFVEIGQGDDEGNRFTVIFSDLDIIVRHQFGEGGDSFGPLGICQGHKAPVVLPGVIENFQHDRRIGQQFLAAHAAHHNPV